MIRVGYNADQPPLDASAAPDNSVCPYRDQPHRSAIETPPPRWLSTEQIRKQQRMRRQTVITAMLAGELPYEQRGRIRYARDCDVRAWEEKRLKRGPAPRYCEIHADLRRFL